jgi:hypothetical protein
MRQFKFRAWDKKHGAFSPTRYWLLDPAGVVRWQYDNKDASNGLEVQQWTGLRDKNDQYIYEGDIIKCAHGYTRPQVVRWTNYGEDNHPGFMVGDKGGWGPIEIIGNILENPTLL